MNRLTRLLIPQRYRFAYRIARCGVRYARRRVTQQKNRKS